MTTTAPSIDHAVSADGTRIGFERLGSGPALVLVQGAMGTAYTYRELAQALPDSFTVVVPDRRGRGLSPHPFTADYTIEDDVSDLDAVLQATGARFVFGLSSGGDITLKAASALPRIEKIALYEPAIFPDGVPRKGVERFNSYAARADLAGMLVTGMKVAQLGPGFLRAMPDWAVKSALLLGGGKSPAYLGAALDQLERVIPTVRRVTLDGLDHAAAWNIDPQRNPHGDPKAVAEQLRAYLATR